MKPTMFPQATGFLPATTIGEGGKPQALNYHFWSNGKLNISVIEITDEEIEKLKQSKKFFLVLPGNVPAPFTLQIDNPFVPSKQVILDGNGDAYMKASTDGKEA